LLAHQPGVLTDGVVCEIGPFLLTYRGQLAQTQSITTDGGGTEPESTAADTPPSVSLPVAAEVTLVPVRLRLTSPAPLATGPDSRYLRDLPVIFHEQDFFGRFLQIFESIWEPLEQREDHIDMYFDPRTCPALFIPWLASWLHIAVNPHWPEARRRALAADAMELYRWRGTKYGLARLLEVCTGVTPDVRDDSAQPYVFRVTVTLPSGSDIRRELIEELIETHKPAHAGYVLEVRS
jgi:phage tail-like protein